MRSSYSDIHDMNRNSINNNNNNKNKNNNRTIGDDSNNKEENVVTVVDRNRPFHIDAASSHGSSSDVMSFHGGGKKHAAGCCILEQEKGRVFQIAGEDSRMETSSFLAVHPLKRYKFSCQQKASAGCDFYVYIVCFDASFRELTAWTLCRGGEPAILECAIDAVDNNNETQQILVCDRPLVGWNERRAPCHSRSIGFYFRGTDDLVVDDVMMHVNDYRSTEDADGAYYKINGRLIHLSRPLPPAISNRILWNETVVRNHWGNSTYMYPFLQSNTTTASSKTEQQQNRQKSDYNINNNDPTTVLSSHGKNKHPSNNHNQKEPNKWHAMESIINGSSSERSDINHTKFRFGTRYIKLGALITNNNNNNYNSDQQLQQLRINHLRFEELVG